MILQNRPFFNQKTPKYSKNMKQKIGKKGISFGRIIKRGRNMLDDIIMYVPNKPLQGFVEPVNGLIKN